MSTGWGGNETSQVKTNQLAKTRKIPGDASPAAHHEMDAAQLVSPSPMMSTASPQPVTVAGRRKACSPWCVEWVAYPTKHANKNKRGEATNLCVVSRDGRPTHPSQEGQRGMPRRVKVIHTSPTRAKKTTVSNSHSKPRPRSTWPVEGTEEDRAPEMVEATTADRAALAGPPPPAGTSHGMPESGVRRGEVAVEGPAGRSPPSLP